LNTIIITLFEKQIIRNYTSDDLKLISKLASTNKIFIFTSSQNFELLSNLVDGSHLTNIEIITLNLKKASFYLRAIFALLKWSHDSTTIVREIRLKNSPFQFMFLKIFINYFLKNFNAFNSLLRFLVLKNFNHEKFLVDLNTELHDSDLVNCKTVFITSLTNRFDLQIALFAKVMHFKILGTVRSWDNLTSHGNLLVEPDIFYSHSQFMTDTLIEFHNFDPGKIVTITAPNYRETYRPLKLGNKSNPPIKIGYGCMGSKINPDDKNFMIDFNNIAKQYSDKEFYIIQHPIFPHSIDFDLSSNLKVLQFDYEKINLTQYYNELSKLDLLVAGGSSILLDAAFIEIPIGYIAFEVVPQNYWVSALRYMDYVYHFHKFIELTGVRTIRSKNDLINIINHGDSNQDILNSSLSSHFLGNIEIDLSDKLFSLLSKG
jgi:hypothetical protein